MILELVIKILDRGIQILKEHQKQKREIFNDRILPVFNDFEVLHKNYLESFDQYRKIINESKELNPEHEIFDTIYSNHLFTKNIRSKISTSFKLFPEDPFAHKIGSGGKLIPPSPKARKETEIEKFIHEIYYYFNYYQHLIFEDDHFMHSNSPRSSLVTGLKYIFSLNETGIDEIKNKLKESPLIFLKQPNGDKRNFYKFSCWYSTKGSFGHGDKPEGLWKKLLKKIENENSDFEIKKSLSIALIDKIINSSQYRYENVCKSFVSLKNEHLI